MQKKFNILAKQSKRQFKIEITRKIITIHDIKFINIIIFGNFKTEQGVSNLRNDYGRQLYFSLKTLRQAFQSYPKLKNEYHTKKLNT